MYAFLNNLQVTEAERLIARSEKLKNDMLGGMMDQAQGQKARPKMQPSKPVDSSDEEEDKQDQVPVGFDYQDNFPELPDWDG